MATNSMFSVSTIAQKAKFILPPTNRGLDNENPASQLTEQQVHIWEHAALLYHGYEWQAAADTFVLLSKDIHHAELRLFCLLNTAMIVARLGDYGTAVTILHTAAQVDATSTMATFLRASVAYLLGDYPTAEERFAICLAAISNDKAIDYRNVGLHFVLDEEIVHNNLREACIAPSGRSVLPNRIQAIPAEFIFEAPMRCNATSTSAGDDQKQSSARRKLANFVTPAPVSVKSSRLEEGGDTSAVNLRPRQSRMPEALHPALRCPRNLGTCDSSMSTSPDAETRFAKARHLSWRGRPKTPYTPRNEHKASDNTGELAKFIKRSGQANPMIPRDPKGEYESVQELSTFAHAYAPDTVRSQTPEPFDLDPRVVADICIAAMLTEYYGSERRSEPKNDAPTAERPVVQQSNEQLSYSDNSEATIPAVCLEEADGEILLPTVYRAPLKRAPHQPNGSCNEPGAAKHANAQNIRQLSSKSDSSSEERRIRQRALTLDALEGRCDRNSAWNKTYPPHGKSPPAEAGSRRESRASWRFRSPSPVDTEHFIDEVLEQWKRS